MFTFTSVKTRTFPESPANDTAFLIFIPFGNVVNVHIEVFEQTAHLPAKRTG